MSRFGDTRAGGRAGDLNARESGIVQEPHAASIATIEQPTPAAGETGGAAAATGRARTADVPAPAARDACPHCGAAGGRATLLTSMTRYYVCVRCAKRWQVARRAVVDSWVVQPVERTAVVGEPHKMMTAPVAAPRRARVAARRARPFLWRLAMDTARRSWNRLTLWGSAVAGMTSGRVGNSG